MTITTEISKVTDLSTESVTVNVADKTDMILVASDFNQNTNKSTAIYTLSGADPGYPIAISVNCDAPNQGSKNRYGSFSLKTWVKQSSDVTDITTRWPISAGMWYSVAGDAPLALADLDELFAAMYSYTYLSVAAGVRNTTWLAKLLAGSPQVK